jgi:hypothetical protein
MKACKLCFTVSVQLFFKRLLLRFNQSVTPIAVSCGGWRKITLCHFFRCSDLLLSAALSKSL